MIERHWKGICKVHEAENYRNHLTGDTFKTLALINGFKGSRILMRTVPAGVEFLVITIWHSIADIQQFAGDDAEIAVVPKFVKNLMITYDQTAAHYEIAGGLTFT